MTSDTRAEALNQAVRVNLALGGDEPSETIVARAEAFEKFLTAI